MAGPRPASAAGSCAPGAGDISSCPLALRSTRCCRSRWRRASRAFGRGGRQPRSVSSSCSKRMRGPRPNPSDVGPARADLLDRHRESGRETLDDHDEALAVGFAGGQVAQHRCRRATTNRFGPAGRNSVSRSVARSLRSGRWAPVSGTARVVRWTAAGTIAALRPRRHRPRPSRRRAAARAERRSGRSSDAHVRLVLQTVQLALWLAAHQRGDRVAWGDAPVRMACRPSRRSASRRRDGERCRRSPVRSAPLRRPSSCPARIVVDGRSRGQLADRPGGCGSTGSRTWR